MGKCRQFVRQKLNKSCYHVLGYTKILAFQLAGLQKWSEVREAQHAVL